MAVHVVSHGDVAVVSIDNPPVNALGLAVRRDLLAAAARLEADASVAAVVLTGAGSVFVGGADITEFDKPVEEPSLPAVIAAIEASRKPWVAAVQGVALGGGMELALGCRFRVAKAEASFALPEVNLGIIPGAGGTQRLPRVIGVAAAIPVVAETQTLTGVRAAGLGLVDRLVEGDVVAGAIAFARKAAQVPLPRSAADRPALGPDPSVWTDAEARIRSRSKGASAPLLALAALRLGVEKGFATGLAQERATFLALRSSDEAAALRYLFFAERAAAKPADLRGVTPRPIRRAGVIGAGTMGIGIAAALRGADYSVVIVDRDDDSLDRGKAALAAILDAAQRKGNLTADQVQARKAGVSFSLAYDRLKDCDLIIEAVFEDLAVKQAVFAELGRVVRPDAILATNTSYLDPRQIAKDLPGPDRFLGLHFFSPAQVMKLVEIIPTPGTAPDVVAAGFALARALGKIPVRAGICDGFIGNRILKRYRTEAEVLLMSGIPLQDIDAAMRSFGMAMGPFEMQDMAGLEISFMLREAARARGEVVPETPADILVRAGRKGQKTGGGWYDYHPGDRTPHVSPETARLLGPIPTLPIAMTAEQISRHLLAAMAAEGQAILDEGIARQASEIDLVEVHGYGFPRRLGGPMFLTARAGKAGAVSPPGG